MVLDPLTAVGLAANLLQFIDFGCQILSKSRRLHKSPSGYLIEHQELKVASERLDDLQHGIDRSLRDVSAQVNPTPAEEALGKVTKRCQVVAERLKAGLQEFAVEQGQSRWKSLRQAFKAIWGKEEVDAMWKQLQEQREQLTMHLLVVVR